MNARTVAASFAMNRFRSNLKNKGNALRPQYIAIEGVIGAGKTSLAEKLADHLSGKELLEPHEENPFLKDFYKNPQQSANYFPFAASDRFKRANSISLAFSPKNHFCNHDRQANGGNTY